MANKFLNVALEERDFEKEASGFFGNWAKYEIEKKKKAAYDWRYENSINNGSKVEIDGDYSKWRINNSLAKHKDTILYANEMNMNSHITDQMHYDYLYNSIRKLKRYSPKRETKQEKAARESEQALISLISDHYKYNIVRAKEVLKILTAEQIDEIRKKQEKGGVK